MFKMVARYSFILVIMLHKLNIWKHLFITWTKFRREALCFTFSLTKNFIVKVSMSNNLISPGDVASFPLKICCFSQGNIRYGFDFIILHTWMNLMNPPLCAFSFSFSWHLFWQKRWVNTNFMEIQMKASFHRLMLKKDGDRATWEYPFAAAGINISFMLIQMLDLCSGLYTAWLQNKNNNIVSYDFWV